MAQSLSKIYVHLIFSTKDRERTLPDEIRPDLHAYMGGTLKASAVSRSKSTLSPTICMACFSLHGPRRSATLSATSRKARTTGFGAEARSLGASFGRRDSVHSR